MDRTTPEGKAHQAKILETIGIDTNKRMVLVMGKELYAKLQT
jgi:hypothetical protein